MNSTGTARGGVGWDDRVNAEQYAAFARNFPMYRRTSASLVRLGGVPEARCVVDLACGTGITTETVLEALPAPGRIVAVDASAAMLAVAASEVTSPRVRWVQSTAEECDAHVSAGEADVAICNSAIWHTDLDGTCRAVHAALAPGGRFAFNISVRNLALGSSEGAGRPAMPMLMQWACALAADRKGCVPDPDVGFSTPRLTVDSVREALHRNGIELVETGFVDHVSSVAEQRAWMSVPIFSTSLTMLRSLSYTERLEVIDEAYQRCDKDAVHHTRWFVALGIAG
jgi:SAM-dependent methyltransferase